MKISLTFAFIFILGFGGIVVMHENVHVEIYRSYGIESHIEYFSHFPDAVTIGEEPCPTEICILAHNINEAITYPLQIFYGVIGLALLFIMLIIESIYDYKEKEFNERRLINGS